MFPSPGAGGGKHVKERRIREPACGLPIKPTEAALVPRDQPHAGQSLQFGDRRELPHERVQRILNGPKAPDPLLRFGQFSHTPCQLVALLELGRLYTG